MSSTVDPAAPGECENCGAPLYGHYCHQCGQPVLNPVRNAGHALEEVFESFWHLDGRIFRTLRDLMVPARVACNYLAGHRARYIAPLRLFVILSVLTFFVGRMTVDFGDVQVELGDNAIASGKTVAEVERRRDEALKTIDEAQVQAPQVPGVQSGLATARAKIQSQAATRITELQSGAAASQATGASSGLTPTPAGSRRGDGVAAGAPGSAGEPAAAAPATVTAKDAEANADDDKPQITFFGGKAWDAQTNPLTVPWLPAFANTWLNNKIGRAITNAPRLRTDPELRKRVVLGSVPTALFVLMPVFALLLKLAYVRQRRLYLEHLVVALYSHAFLLLALLGIFVMVGLEHWLTPMSAAAGRVLGWLEVAAWWWMPAYLLIMQKRVYGQGWTMTSLKYFVLGSAYLVLVVMAALTAGLAGLAKL